MPISLVLADDHPIVLQGLVRLFERYPEFRVAHCCASGAQALDAVRREPPDVLVLDLRMNGMNGLDVLRALALERRPCRTVLLTAAMTSEEIVEAVKLGARGLALKESSPESLLECVRRVHRGEQCIEQEMLARALEDVWRGEAASRAGESLTAREMEIVRMVARGLRNRAIGEQLSISEGTVKVHLHNIYEKCGVAGRLELVLFAQEKGLV
jgi:DNA-binding NarL/FixJ family response regulator